MSLSFPAFSQDRRFEIVGRLLNLHAAPYCREKVGVWRKAR